MQQRFIEVEEVANYGSWGLQGSLNGTQFWGIKQCNYMVILRDFPYNSALFGLVLTMTPGLETDSI